MKIKNFWQEHSKKCIVALWAVFLIFHWNTAWQTILNFFAILAAPQIAIVPILITVYLLRHLLMKQSRPIQVLLAFAASLLLLEWLMWLLPALQKHWFSGAEEKLWENKNFGTAVVAFVSAPVAFVLWHFRDENQRNDIEAKRKDVNLKEFQKISEWVMGAHFGEAEKEKHSEKFSGSLKNDFELSLTERGREYHIPTESKLALHTFSKKDGAVGLQIAAVYNLLPFYRGDYGKDFEKPALHLLLSAWKVLQNDVLRKLEQQQALKQANNLEEPQSLIPELHQRADSPLGQAITRVLLECENGQPLLHRHPEVLAGICLSGMDFGLVGVKTEVLKQTLFPVKNWTGAQLQGLRGTDGFNFSGAVLNEVKLSNIFLNQANFSNAQLNGAYFFSTFLESANFSRSSLENACFSTLWLNEANFSGAWLEQAIFIGIGRLHKPCESILNAENLFAALMDNETFLRYPPEKQKILQDKGLIVLYKGTHHFGKKLILIKNTGNNSLPIITAKIPFPIDLEKTRKANPEWNIDIQ